MKAKAFLCPLVLISCLFATTAAAPGEPKATSSLVLYADNYVEGAPAEETSQPDHFNISDMAGALLQLINQARATNRLCGGINYPATQPVTEDPRLDRAAQGHSEDMMNRNYFSHIGLDGSTPWARMERQGYHYSVAGENIAAGYSTAEEVMQGWLESAGHCSNIMNAEMTQAGIGFASGNGLYKYYWTLDLARPSRPR